MAGSNEDDAGRIPPGMGGSKWRKPSRPTPGQAAAQPTPGPGENHLPGPTPPIAPPIAPIADGTVPSNAAWEALNVDVDGFRIDLRPEIGRLMALETMDTEAFVREALVSMTICGMVLQGHLPPGVDRSDKRVQSVMKTARRVLGFIERHGRTPIPGVDELD